jgi:hypothetical protein
MSAAVGADWANVFRALWEPSITLEHEVSPSCKFRVKKRYLEFRLRQFKMLLDAVEDYVRKKHPVTGGHS